MRLKLAFPSGVVDDDYDHVAWNCAAFVSRAIAELAVRSRPDRMRIRCPGTILTTKDRRREQRLYPASCH